MRERVFDTRLYKDLPEIVRPLVIREDLAGLVIEAGYFSSLADRINPRKFKIRGEDIIDPVSNESVFNDFSQETSLARKETKAAMSFYNHLLLNPIGAMSISISPSGGEAGYFEGRVNVGTKVDSEEIEIYGIPTHLSPKTLFNRAILLNEHSSVRINLSGPEDLREISIPFVIPGNEKPWVFLNEVFPLDSDAWDAIRQGRPWLLKKKAIHDAGQVSELASLEIAGARTYTDYLYVGAQAEQMMENAGWRFNFSGCPGLFNTQILEMLQARDLYFVKDSFGNTRLSEKKYVQKCGKCGTRINSYISKGYRCTNPKCGGIYEGC